MLEVSGPIALSLLVQSFAERAVLFSDLHLRINLDICGIHSGITRTNVGLKKRVSLVPIHGRSTDMRLLPFALAGAFLVVLLSGQTLTIAQETSNFEMLVPGIQLGDTVDAHVGIEGLRTGEFATDEGRLLFTPDFIDNDVPHVARTLPILITSLEGNYSQILPGSNGGFVTVRYAEPCRSSCERYGEGGSPDELVLFDPTRDSEQRILFSPGGQLQLLALVGTQYLVLVYDADDRWLASVDSISGEHSRAELPGFLRFGGDLEASGYTFAYPLGDRSTLIRCGTELLCTVQLTEDRIEVSPMEFAQAEICYDDDELSVLLLYDQVRCDGASPFMREEWRTEDASEIQGFPPDFALNQSLLVDGEIRRSSVTVEIEALDVDWIELPRPESALSGAYGMAGIMAVSNDVMDGYRVVELLMTGRYLHAELSYTGFEPEVTWGIALGSDQIEVRSIPSTSLRYVRLRFPEEPGVMCGFPQLRFWVLGGDDSDAVLTIPLGGPCEGA